MGLPCQHAGVARRGGWGRHLEVALGRACHGEGPVGSRLVRRGRAPAHTRQVNIPCAHHAQEVLTADVPSEKGVTSLQCSSTMHKQCPPVQKGHGFGGERRTRLVAAHGVGPLHERSIPRWRLRGRPSPWGCSAPARRISSASGSLGRPCRWHSPAPKPKNWC